MVLDEDDADHIEQLLEALASGYHIDAPDEEKQEQYDEMLTRFQNARP